MNKSLLRIKNQNKFKWIKYKIINIILFPIRIIFIPIFKMLDKCKTKKEYSYKTIIKLVQYCIDYHLSNDECIYVALNNYVGEECSDNGIYSYSSLCDLYWSYTGQSKRVKNKISHVYHYQKDEYIKAVKELCGNPLSDEEKKQEFTKTMSDGETYLAYIYYRIQDKEICKINNTNKEEENNNEKI